MQRLTIGLNRRASLTTRRGLSLQGVDLTGLPLTVMIAAASLPIGANVFMFSQRYEVAEELVTAGVAVSTGAGGGDDFFGDGGDGVGGGLVHPFSNRLECCCNLMRTIQTTGVKKNLPFIHSF